MLRFKIFTARGEGDVSKVYDGIGADVERFINRLPEYSGASVEWHQSPQGEYSVRLTAIVSYMDMMTAES